MIRADRSAQTVAVIDDDSGFVTVLCKRLEQSGWRHVLLGSAPPAEELVAMRLDAILIDPALLGQSSWDVLQRIADALPSTGLVVCTGPSSVAQRVRGLRMGIDDWIGKPCHPEEVVARLDAVTRRHRRAAAAGVAEAGPLAVGELEFRTDRFEVLCNGRPVDLTKREYELLLLLAGSDGRVLPRPEVYQRVWGYAMARGDRSVDVFVRKIRHKLEAASPGWLYVHTHFGVGYRFEATPVDGSAAEPLSAASPDATAGDLLPAAPAGATAAATASPATGA